MGDLLRFRRDRKAVYIKVTKNTFDDVYREQFLREWSGVERILSNTDMNDLMC
jgi:hypothetical protein